MDTIAKLVRIMWVPVLVFLCYTGWIIWRQRHPGTPPARVESDPMAATDSNAKTARTMFFFWCIVEAT